MNSVVSDLKHLIECEISGQQEDLAAVSQDFGGIIQKQPQVVVCPQNSTDVAKAVKYAVDKELTISSRAAAHTSSGQSLNQGGILLDMKSLNQIHEFRPDYLWFKADAGITWKNVVDASIPHGVIPPVLTNNFDVTIGGTHSAGGLGRNSFRYGSQADNCLGLEVVTGTGDLIWCTPEQNSELFYHVLCGYGQFGIITQIQHRLRQYHPFTRTYFLCYDDLEFLLSDERRLVLEERVDGLLSLFSPCVMGVSRTGGDRIQPLIKWFYRMQITLEVDSASDIDEEELLSSLSFYRHIHTEDLTFDKFIQPIAEVPSPVGTANPWIDVLLPGSVAKEYIETALKRIPSFIDFRNTPVGSFCLVSRNTSMPMFPLPEEEFILGFGMYPTIPKSQLQSVIEQVNLLSDLGFQVGGKRYMASWVEFDLPRWRLQFGDYWSKVNEMKRKYDPKGILNPGFFQYERVAELQMHRQQTQITSAFTTSTAVAVDVAPYAEIGSVNERKGQPSGKST
ncbi:MAG: FAD-binding protein [Stigonema ocellatum SAG 48.90 = DSM 106950]|nr:FAD-binding protein [Stigonema ocellatum SAG 48.90 = DSM 106950]